MKKKIYILLLIFFMIFSFSACSQQQELNETNNQTNIDTKKEISKTVFKEIISFNNNYEPYYNFSFYVDQISNNIYFKVYGSSSKTGLSILYDKTGNPMKYKKESQINPEIKEYVDYIQKQEYPEIYKTVLSYYNEDFGSIECFVDTITDIVYFCSYYCRGISLSVLLDDNGKPIKMHLPNGKINPKMQKYIPNY